MSKKEIQEKMHSYRQALGNLQELVDNNPETFEVLFAHIETYNRARADLEGVARAIGSKITVGPFSVSLRKNTVVDIETIALAAPRVLLEPGVTTKVDVTKLRDAAARNGVLATIDAAITEGKPTVSVSKGEAKELVLSWPEVS